VKTIRASRAREARRLATRAYAATIFFSLFSKGERDFFSEAPH